MVMLLRCTRTRKLKTLWGAIDVRVHYDDITPGPWALLRSTRSSLPRIPLPADILLEYTAPGGILSKDG